MSKSTRHPRFRHRLRTLRSLASIAVIAAFPIARAGADDLASPPPPVHASAHREITTRVPEAQAAYNDGLIRLYAFNVGAARGDFARAADLDPNCAMAFYGQALTEITDINVDTDGASLARGRADVARARKAREASPIERTLIAAVARRFAPAKDDATAQRSYESAMRDYTEANKSDADGAVEAAFAVWKAEPNLQTKLAAEIGTLLDRALALDPNQFGAHHLRVHYEEEIEKPAAALPDATFLDAATYDPGESHLPHMAGHIYIRLGDYARAVASNETAIANDAVYFAHGDAAGIAYMRGYHDHDLDFVLYGLTTLGRDDEARQVAAREDPYARAAVALREHDWTAVLAARATDKTAIAIADARLGKLDVALAAARTDDNKPPPAFVARLIDGASARARGDIVAAVKAYAAAYAARPTFLGDPKYLWYAPIGEAYGAALLRARRYAEAETVFTAELTRYPNDPHLLFGRAYARTGLHEDATADRAAANALWQGHAIPSVDDLG